MKFIATGQLAVGFLAFACSFFSLSGAFAQEQPPGITDPIVFAPFNPDAPPCTPPSGLTKVLAFARDNDRDFMKGVAKGLSLAARDRNLEYRSRHPRGSTCGSSC